MNSPKSPPELPIIHRDLSWLQFNSRVLGQAQSKELPLLERLKFLSISASNLDEFFLVRFNSLERSIATFIRNGKEDKAAELTQLRSVMNNAIRILNVKQSEALAGLRKELKLQGIHIHLDRRPKDEAKKMGREIFIREVLPQLGEPVPFTSKLLRQTQNLEMIAILGEDTAITVSKKLPATYLHRDENSEFHIFFLDLLILEHLPTTLGSTKKPWIFRLTRDGDFAIEISDEDPDTIPDVIRKGVSARELGKPVRVQLSGQPQNTSRHTLKSGLRLKEDQLYPAPKTLCIHGLWSISDQLRETGACPVSLFYEPFQSMVAFPFKKGSSIFEEIRKNDFLLHHPYDSFDSFVHVVQAACADPKITQIDLTIYRMDILSPILTALKSAAKGKKIRTAIELRARFDEMNNLQVSEELRQAGIQVLFGSKKLKMHAKIALFTRIEENEEVHYTHLSTGNYHSKTARQYTDLAILTADPRIGEDAKRFFAQIESGGEQVEGSPPFTILTPAPTQLHRIILQKIRAEMKAAKSGKPARIVAKVNALVDTTIIETLYEASQAGVKVDLIVRGACSLIPGIKGISDNIQVVGIVDRFLEHSRIYSFESSDSLYLSSADWMPRNFFSRLEIAFPILDTRIREFIKDTVLPAYLRDNQTASILNNRGVWRRRNPTAGEPPFHAQAYFMQLARTEYADTPLSRKKN